MKEKSDDTYLEANLPEFLSIHKEAAIKDKRGLVHGLIDALPVQVQELLPLGGNDDRLGAFARIQR